jgi:hypothetical protein
MALTFLRRAYSDLYLLPHPSKVKISVSASFAMANAQLGRSDHFLVSLMQCNATAPLVGLIGSRQRVEMGQALGGLSWYRYPNSDFYLVFDIRTRNAIKVKYSIAIAP